MARPAHRRRRRVRALHREAPSTVAVLTAESDFGAMRTYRTFAFDDYAGYLRHVELLLRTLARQGVHTRLARFDPQRFAAYCAARRRDPDTTDSRARFTAELACGGPTVPYDGRRLRSLLPLLRGAPRHRDRRRPGPGAAARPAEDALARAAELLDRLLESAGPGRHRLVCSVTTPGTPLLAALDAGCSPDGALRPEPRGALLFRHVLAAGLATGSPGGVVMRTAPGPAPAGARETVRGWRLAHGGLSPLSEAEVFSAYCTDPDTGDPVPPEPGVRYAAGTVLPPPGGPPG
ncbi:hypothetical protein [Streptomyces sp. JJ36]|uniref:hypothetical protein n=1 Tax=Streptomyces sp. JJ36 TaxID=2736645 RepID=UPI001F41A7E1|nr:hypothetical protein [Streptomyces sp. JJ36]MCF6525414.1 hypothetical protein [Streptomyces sp. JJ36]